MMHNVALNQYLQMQTEETKSVCKDVVEMKYF